MSEPAPMQQPSTEEQQQETKSERTGRGERGSRRRRHQQHQSQPPANARRPDPSLNMDELRDLVQLIAEHGFTDFELEREGFRVRLRRELAPQIVNAAGASSNQAAAQTSSISGTKASTGHGQASLTPHPGAEAEAAASVDEDLHIITSPIVGTFYRAPSPTADTFVRIGSSVEPDTVVCIIEAMKLMNEIQAETRGEVVKIYVENGQPVEYGQPLFGIKQ